jgi:hypothetical protein
MGREVARCCAHGKKIPASVMRVFFIQYGQMAD